MRKPRSRIGTFSIVMPLGNYARGGNRTPPVLTEVNRLLVAILASQLPVLRGTELVKTRGKQWEGVAFPIFVSGGLQQISD